MSCFETPSFRKLLIFWNKKLAESNFEDIDKEITENSKHHYLSQTQIHPKRFHSFDFRNYFKDQTFFYKREEYFQKSSYFLNHYHFNSEKEKSIWELHSEGLSIRKIASNLKLKNWVVHKVVKNLQKELISFKYTDKEDFNE